jgi:integrase
MARATNKLTTANLKTKTPGVYADGGGLYLQVSMGKDGEPKRSWLCRVRVGGKVRELGLGRPAEVPLAAARERCAEYRRLAAAGIDPLEHQKAMAEAKAAEEAERRARAMTFKQAAEAYIAAHEKGWKNEKHRKQWTATLEAYAYPKFGDVPVGAVDRTMVLAVIEPLWRTRTETASRLRGRIENVLDWATVRGLRTGENPARWRGALEMVLPARSKVQRKQHHPAMPYDQVGAFIAVLRTKPSVGADCLQFVILTGARYNEAAGARWGEIDLLAETWTIPGERMKAGKTHRVALSSAALEILRRRAKHGTRPDALVFESDLREGAKLSDMTLSAYLRRAGLPYTVHGFRASFRIWAAEKTEYPREVAEAALAHTNADRVEAAYQRSDFFEKRRGLMQAWADYLGKPHQKI